MQAAEKLHKFEQGGVYVLLDINSGAVYEVDRETFQLPYARLCELLNLDVSTDTPDYSEYADMNVNAPLKAMCLHVSHDCNLKCRYCFADGITQENAIMTAETAKRAVDFLLANCGEREHLEIDFFGGEPLMAWETVVETVEYAKTQARSASKEFRFTITTNGLLLDDEKTAYINREMSNVVLSLDGRREINDAMRPCMSGKGSYDLILPKFKKLIAARINPGFTDYFIRGTFTRNNLDFAADVQAIAALGFRNISIEPVALPDTSPLALTLHDLPRIKSEYDRLFEVVRENNDGLWNFFHFRVDLEGGPCILKRLRGCGAGNEYVAVTPDGAVYPCHRYVGMERWKMGNINGGGLDSSIKEYFAKTHIYAKEKCLECWARFYCGGGCNAENFLFEGDSRTPPEMFCEMFKKRLECAIALAVINT